MTYFLSGLLLVFGLNSVFDTNNAYFVRWMKAPHVIELVFQVIKVFLVLLGAAMVVDGVFWLLGRPLIQV